MHIQVHVYDSCIAVSPVAFISYCGALICLLLHCLYFSVSLIDRQYREYLEHVLEYLTSFLYRTEPLQDIEKIFLKVSLILPFFYINAPLCSTGLCDYVVFHFGLSSTFIAFLTMMSLLYIHLGAANCGFGNNLLNNIEYD